MKPNGKCTILVIDDDIRTRVVLEDILREKGWEVESVRTGHEGVRRVLNNGIDVAIVDIKLPDCNGMDVIRVIKEYHPEVYIIALTAYPNVEDAVKALKYGAFDYIEKPVDLVEITKSVERAVRDLRNNVHLRKKSTSNYYRSNLQ